MESDVDPSASFTDEVTVVLKNDPRLLPMVCGMCGAQFSTGRGLEVHMRTHKMDRRKKASRGGRKPAAASSRSRAASAAEEATAAASGGSTVDESGLRKSMRTPKRKTADEQYVYIYEVDADGELLSDEALAAAASANGSVHLASAVEDDGGNNDADADWGPRSGASNTAAAAAATAAAAAAARSRVAGINDGCGAGRPVAAAGGAVLLRQPPVSLVASAAASAVPPKPALVYTEFTKEGVPIARLDDYFKSEMIVPRVEQRLSSASNTEVGPAYFGLSSASSATLASTAVSAGAPAGGASTTDGAVRQPVEAFDDSAARRSGATGSGVVLSVSEGGAEGMEVVETADAGGPGDIQIVFERNQPGIITKSDVAGSSPDHSSSEQNGEKACEMCLTVLPSSLMRQHMLEDHVACKQFPCRYDGCHQMFTDVFSFRQHMVVHGIGSAVCDICNEVLSDSASLSAHVRNMHGDDAVAAGGVGSNSGAEDDEEEIGAGPGEHACQFCGKVFKNRRAHSSHMKKHTKPLEPSECDRCGRTFRHKTALKFHQKMNTDCDKSKYVCDLCGYKGTSPWRLASHRNQVHSTDRPFQCEICPKTFKTREMMKLHMHKMHTGVPQLDCTMCSRKFFYKAELREHMQIHSEVKSFECHICHRAFKTMHVLRGHLSGKHSDTWYTCCFCKFTTSHKKSMKRHMVLVHKLADVTLEVKPDDSRAIQLELPPGEGDVQLHIPEGSIQYDDQLCDGIVTTTVISEDGGAVAGGSIESVAAGGECIVTTTVGHASSNPAVEVSEVLVALSGISEQSMVSGSSSSTTH